MITLTQQELKAVLEYSPQDGTFKRVACPVKNQIKPGSVAGAKNKRGYILIRVNGKKYAAHRLAWLYMEGKWPENEIDHRDKDKTNNRWENLRESNRSENVRNTGKRKGKTSSKYKGVSWHKGTQSWQWQLSVGPRGNRITHSGRCATELEAAIAYNDKAKEIHGDYYFKA